MPEIQRRPLRVFQVVWAFQQFGGLEHHLAELALALARRGDDVLVFTEAPVAPDNAYAQRLRAAGISVSGASPFATAAFRLGELPLGKLWRVAVHMFRVVRWLQARATPVDRSVARKDEQIMIGRGHHPVTADLFRRMDAAIAEARPDVVHVHGTRLRHGWVVRWAAARGIPTVYTEHITLDEWGGPGDPHMVAPLLAQLGALACVSERSRASLLAVVGDTMPVTVVRHIVSGDATPPASAANGPLRLVSAARLEAYKGIDVLLRALARARGVGADVHLTIAGDGAERGSLEALARSLSLDTVRFLGAVAPDSVGALMRDADVVVLSSRGEGLPVALLEAMANGRPMIATRSGGMAEVLIDGETGVLVTPDNPEELAAAFVLLSADRPAVTRMGAAARRAWEEGGWTPDAILAETDALYGAARVRADALARRP